MNEWSRQMQEMRDRADTVNFFISWYPVTLSAGLQDFLFPE